MRTITLSKIDYRQYDENESGQVVETTIPVVVQVEANPLLLPAQGRPAGTRITFTDGGGFAVADTVEAVSAAVTGASACAVQLN